MITPLLCITMLLRVDTASVSVQADSASAASVTIDFGGETVQRERLALVERQLAHWTPMREEVELEAARADLETRQPSAIP